MGVFQQILQQMINGLSLGSIYALLALGYTMVYGILRLINFAHGDIYMLGAYIGYFCMTTLHLGFLPSLLIAMVLCTLVGITIEKIAYKPLRNATRIAVLITAIGVSLFIEYGTMYIASPNPRSYPRLTGFMAKSYQVGGLTFSAQQILIIIITVVLMILLQLNLSIHLKY